MSPGNLLRVILSSVVLVLATIAAGAQQQAANSSYLGEARAGYSVYFFGDSLAGGLWAGSIRMTKGDPRITTKGRYKEGSGLSRAQFYDWPAALPPIVERNIVDIAVIMIGINDGQAVKLADRQLPVASKEWKEYYQSRVDDMLQALKSKGIPVYWMELPPMADPVRDEVSKLVASMQRERAEAAGIRYVEIRKQFLKEDGSYTDSGIDVEGQFRRLRSRDGVHFIRPGNDKIARMVLDAIKRDIEIADGTRKPEPEDLVAVAPDADTSAKPIFSKEMNLGEAAIIDDSDLPKIDEITIARSLTTGATGLGTGAPAEQITGAEALKALRETAAPGSDAQRLFVTGQWPPAQPGRFDDFGLLTE